MKRLCIFSIIFWFLFISMSFGDEWVAYTQPTGNYWQIWINNITGGIDQQLTKSPYDKKTPVWSPDGTRILYRTGNGEFYIVNIDTKEEKKILEEVRYCADPSWISDNEILFARYRTDIIDDSDIWLINIETSKRKVLVSEPGLQYQPSLSRDKQKLIYVKALNAQNHHLFIKDMVSNKEAKLTQFKGYNFMPSISPDAKLVVFVSNQTGDSEIWLMDLENLSIKQVTHNPGLDTDPEWIDSQRIIYSSYQNAKFQINVMDITNLESKVLIKKDKDCCNPDWIRK